MTTLYLRYFNIYLGKGAGDMGSSPGSERSLGEGNGNPLQYSGNPVDTGTWRATVHGIAKEADTAWQ